MTATQQRWHKTAVAAAATVLFGLSAPSAWSLSLGPIIVQSALGEPLRAEIDIPEINAEEAASLKASIASQDAFRAAGLEFNAALTGLRATLQRRANGGAFLRLVTDRAVTEPFVDMILEANWATGRIVRDYTMLFDPPNLRGPLAGATPSTQLTPSAIPAMPAPASASTPAPVSPRSANARASSGPAAASAKPAMAGEKQITVKSGDTASKIAAAVKPANVSLDQMLVALLRANPNAFVNDNINRIKAGAVLDVPTAEQAQAIGASEASQTVIAQSRDFGDFRRKLAANAPSTQVAAADRKSSGSVQTQVEDKKAGKNAPDKLTLSKGAVQAQAAADKLASERAAKDAATRTAEVSKNISDLDKMGAAVGKSAAPAAPAVPGAPAVAAVAITPPVAAPAMPAAMPAAVAASSAPSPAAAPVASPAASDAKPAAAKTAKAVAMPAPEPSLIDQLTENPLVPVAGGALVALLAGFGLYRARQRKKASQVDSAFLESRLQPDSFFGASGGQRVDTNDGAGGSSMVYTPSQLDAADDVDPIAEADVYLAYGRDVQAEEILKEALKFNAGRVAIHQKLLEIYAKRRDTKSFETAAKEAFKPTGGEGPEWTRICDLGQSIDPANPLYSPGGKPAYTSTDSTQPMPVQATGDVGMATVSMAAFGGAVAGAAAHSFDAATAPVTPQAPVTGPVDLDFDLDLDFSLDDENASVINDMGKAEQTSKMMAIDSGPAPLDMNFDGPGHDATVVMPAATTGHGALEFSLPTGGNSAKAPLLPSADSEDFRQQAAVSFGTTIPGMLAATVPKPAETAASNAGMMEFDMGSLSLDLGNDAKDGPSTAPQPLQDDPLATKLLLAEEFSSIGDEDGARALIEEVIQESSGDMKTRAQQALAKLS